MLFCSCQRLRIAYAATADSCTDSTEAIRSITRSIIRQLIQQTDTLLPSKTPPGMNSQYECRLASLVRSLYVLLMPSFLLQVLICAYICSFVSIDIPMMHSESGDRLTRRLSTHACKKRRRRKVRSRITIPTRNSPSSQSEITCILAVSALVASRCC